MCYDKGQFNMHIFKEKGKLISKEPVWVCVHEEYLYIHKYFICLVWQMLFEWKHDKHLVG